jgi:tetratricopeptide (TPR) repeat protein
MITISEIAKLGACLIRGILLAVVLFATPVTGMADEATLDSLFAELQDPANEDWKATEEKIWKEWSRSGSRAMDLLLERGRDDIAAGDYDAAVEHLSALIDHAPEFAEGWNARATAFYLMNQYGLSVADIQRTLVLNPRHFGAMSGLGAILEQTGRLKDALTVYTRALEIHPHQPGVIQAVERLNAEVGGTTL